MRGKGSGEYTASHLTAGGVTHTSPRACVSPHCSKGRLETWRLPPFPHTIVRISWVLFQSSFSYYHRHLLTFLELLQAHPAIPLRAKDLLRRRKAAPTAAPLLWYNSDTACIICEATIMRSFFHLYLLSHGANEDLFSPHGDRNSRVLHLALGKEKYLELLEKLGLYKHKNQSMLCTF